MRPINPATLVSPKGYNNGMLSSSGNVLFVAGQVGWDKQGKMADGLVDQFDLALANIVDVVWAAGGKPEDIGRFTIYVKDKEEYLRKRKAIGEVYRKRMGKHYPAMALLVVADLLEEDAMVEIEATAVIP